MTVDNIDDDGVVSDDELPSDLVTLLDELEADDKLTAENLIDKARDPDNPAHDHFEWDDSVAAHEHRLEQARALIRRPRIRVEGGDTEYITCRRYTFVHSEARYKQTRRALHENHDETTEQCRREARSFRRKWDSLKEFARIVDEELNS